jgi:hypothetical protein
MYLFIDGQLAINLGGIHGANGSELDVSDLGLIAGTDYQLDLFYAERQGKTGDILLTTSLGAAPTELSCAPSTRAASRKEAEFEEVVDRGFVELLRPFSVVVGQWARRHCDISSR